MTQSHFKNLKLVLIEELKKAQTSIYVAVAWFTDQDVLNLLTEKSEKLAKKWFWSYLMTVKILRKVIL